MVMRQVYYCPDCRAPVFYGERFCGNCRTSLKWVIVKTPPPYSPLPYGRPGTGQQTTPYPQPRQYVRRPSGHQEKTGQRPALQQKKAVPEGQAQHRQRYTNNKQAVTSVKKRVPAEDPARVLSSEVSGLLEHLFHKVE